jgi:hypothetical protein
LQSELGFPGDWQPDNATTNLTYDGNDGVWQGTFSIPAGSWEYKAALNNAWDENYGANAVANGPNIAFSLSATESVKFYYDHKSHWATDDETSVIAVAAGSFQSELGCSGDWDPGCLRSWLQDTDGDGTYSFTTSLPAGSYETKVAIEEAWDENYGAGGVANGPNIPFAVPTGGAEVCFSYDAASHVLTVDSPCVASPPAPPVTVSGKGRFNATASNAVTFTLSNEAVVVEHLRNPRFGFTGEVDSVAGAGNSATLTGTGTWNGVGGHTFEISVVDNKDFGRWEDTIDVVIRNAQGTVVFTSSGPRTLNRGDIVVTDADSD